MYKIGFRNGVLIYSMHLPIAKRYAPNPIIKKSANNLAYVNISCTAVAHLTSQQLMNVKTTENKEEKHTRK